MSNMDEYADGNTEPERTTSHLANQQVHTIIEHNIEHANNDYMSVMTTAVAVLYSRYLEG